jgi:DNA polymerase III subunit delta'
LTEQVFPGSRDIADRLLQLIAAGHVGQPFLFIGPPGSGKEVTALQIARRSQCGRAETCRPGDLCESCQKTVTFQHPDIRWFGPAPAGLEDPGKADQIRQIFEAKIRDPFHQPDVAASCQILIGNPDQPGPLTVRGMQQFLRRRTFQGPWKIAIMVDANRLNPAAANALLKTLEEPPPSALIMLLANSLAGLPSTIVSRCQQIMFFPYREDEVRALLARLRPEVDEPGRRQAARCAAGDIRKALDLLTEESRQLRSWTENVFDDLCSHRIGRLHQAAEKLHCGAASLGPSKNSDQVMRRRQALRFCDHLCWLLSETLACRELGSEWQPGIAEVAELVRRAAESRDSDVLLRDIERVERAKHHIQGNLNLGLVMAGLLQDLHDHVRSA